MYSGTRLPAFEAMLCYLLWVTLDKLLSLSEPLFPHLSRGDDDSASVKE